MSRIEVFDTKTIYNSTTDSVCSTIPNILRSIFGFIEEAANATLVGWF